MATLAEQFAATPLDLQSRLFRVLDVVIGMSQDEKNEARELIGQMLSTPIARQNGPACDLLHAVDMLVFIAKRLAEPDVEWRGQPGCATACQVPPRRSRRGSTLGR